MKIQLQRIAHARSGDKGDTANIGVIARSPDYYPLLEKYLTADRVKSRGSNCRILARSIFSFTVRWAAEAQSR
jgi:hypothetical protein